MHGPRCEFRLSPKEVDKICEKLAELRKSMSREFSRRLRSVKNFKFWKATEFRIFLLYTGPVVLKGILKKDAYANFLLLHSAIRTLIDPGLVKLETNVTNAEICLQDFVRSYETMRICEHDFQCPHNLLHLASDARKYRALDNFSAFKFENHMTYIKRLVRKFDQPLKQLQKKLAELSCG